MKALRFHNFGIPSSVLRFEEIPTPTANDGELCCPGDTLFTKSPFSTNHGSSSFAALSREPSAIRNDRSFGHVK